MRENQERMNGSPGKQLFHLPLHFGAGNVEWSDTLRCLGWNNNAVGELTYHYMKTYWRPSTTHEETMQHWITVRNSASYQAGFETAFGQSWQQFVCDLETYYSIDRRTQTCAGVEVPPVRPPDCVVESDDQNWPVWLIVLVFALSFCLPCIGGAAFLVFYCATESTPPEGRPMQPVKRAGFAAVPAEEEMPPLFIP